MKLIHLQKIIKIKSQNQYLVTTKRPHQNIGKVSLTTVVANKAEGDRPLC